MAGLLDGVDLRTQMAGENRLELLLFRLSGRQIYAINVFKVQEVIQCPTLTRVPGSHPVVRGIAKLRGKTVPVMDLSLAIGGAAMENTDARFVIITEYNRRIQGFLVTGVDRIINMNWGDILPPPKGAAGGSYLTAVTQVEKQLVEIIDVEKVLNEVVGASEEVSSDLVEPETREVPRHILVADDSAVARKQVKRVLDQLGIESTLKNNGADAFEQLKQWASECTGEGRLASRLTMVISDIEMPKMDGYSLTKKIREDAQLNDLHVLLHSSLSGVFNEDMVRKVGANDFLAKYDPNELAKLVQERVKEHDTEHRIQGKI
jgi:two-component system chemotaxis response regulator CheV